MIRVLIADDHGVVRAGLAQLLATFPDVELVGSAANGEEAVALAAERSPDVVLMDLEMPVLDGIQATRRIRALAGPAGRVPIIALTANALPGDEEDCLGAGMNGYLSKPVDVLALHEALRRFGPEAPRRPVAVA